MQPQLNDGKPTGRLNDRNEMEVELYVINTRGEKVICGTRWVEITDEQRQKIMAGNNAVVSMGASTDAIEITRSMQTSVHDGSATFRVNGPTLKAVIGDARNVNSAGYYFDSEAIKKLFPEAVETRAEKLADLTIDSINLTTDGVGLRGRGTIVSTDKGAAMHAAAMHPDGIEPVTGTTTVSSMTAKSSANPDQAVERAAARVHIFNPESGAEPESAETKLGEWMDAACIDTNRLHEEMQQDAKIAGTFPAITVDAKNRVTAADRRVLQGERRAENSGGNVNYYSVYIANPKRPERPPYTFEVEDLIQALNMSFHEGTVLKSLIRSCTERELGLKKLGNDSIRDAEKMVHSSTELLRDRKLRNK